MGVQDVLAKDVLRLLGCGLLLACRYKNLGFCGCDGGRDTLRIPGGQIAESVLRLVSRQIPNYLTPNSSAELP